MQPDSGSVNVVVKGTTVTDWLTVAAHPAKIAGNLILDALTFLTTAFNTTYTKGSGADKSIVPLIASGQFAGNGSAITKTAFSSEAYKITTIKIIALKDSSNCGVYDCIVTHDGGCKTIVSQKTRGNLSIDRASSALSVSNNKFTLQTASGYTYYWNVIGYRA